MWKIQLQVKKNCSQEIKFYKDLNLDIKIARSNEKVTNEIKRKGFLIDRGTTLELRSGDTLIVYVSMGGFEK